MRTRLLLFALLLTGCPGGGPGGEPDAGTDAGTDPSPCDLAFLGDPSAPPRFTPTALGPDQTSAVLKEGSPVSLVAPPQGGRVVFIGVREATHLDPCGVSLLAAVRDPVSRQLRLDARTVNLTPAADGTGASLDVDISTFANVPVCPNQWSSESLFGHDYELTLTLKDRAARTVTRTLTIRPACDVPGEEVVCRCLCKKDYKLGEACGEGTHLDGGT